MYIRVLCYI